MGIQCRSRLPLGGVDQGGLPRGGDGLGRSRGGRVDGQNSLGKGTNVSKFRGRTAQRLLPGQRMGLWQEHRTVLDRSRTRVRWVRYSTSGAKLEAVRKAVNKVNNNVTLWQKQNQCKKNLCWTKYQAYTHMHIHTRAHRVKRRVLQAMLY